MAKRPPKILVVDDVPETCAWSRQCLSRGYERGRTLTAGEAVAVALDALD